MALARSFLTRFRAPPDSLTSSQHDAPTCWLLCPSRTVSAVSEWPVVAVAAGTRETVRETLRPTSADLSGQSELIHRPIATKATQLPPCPAPASTLLAHKHSNRRASELNSHTGLIIEPFHYWVSEALSLLGVGGLPGGAGDGGGVSERGSTLSERNKWLQASIGLIRSQEWV